jgi:hypothetical protein
VRGRSGLARTVEDFALKVTKGSITLNTKLSTLNDACSPFALSTLYSELLSTSDAELSPEQIDQYRQNDTQYYGCGKGKVEGEVLLSDQEVAGKTPQPGDFRRNEEKNTDGCN